MRRTYRSKKDTGNGLDPRDVVLAADEKSSAFDAFYIKNLKQTKRELSSMGSSSQYNAVPNKVRKKKFVKRIVKDVENIPYESTSRSAYLTPDKSIRVNKGHDLFDQLLNSSSPRHIEPKVNKDDVFDKVRSLRKTKTYATRKPRKAKKYNYSSSDSNDTDKENESNNVSNNVTDIRAHQLVIEKDISNNLTHQDKSINNIVQNLSLLNNIKNSKSPISPVISFNYNKRRSKNVNSTVDKSVLSSTPFRNIRTATSIYKFSPILKSGSRRGSPNCVSITEENDNKMPTNDFKPSPIVHSKHIHSLKDKDDTAPSFNVNVNNDSDVSVKNNHHYKEAISGVTVQNEDITPNDAHLQPKAENLDCSTILSDSINGSDLQFSLGGSKPSEPFLGFTVVNGEGDLLNANNSEKSLLDIDQNNVNGTMSMNVVDNEIRNDSIMEVALGGSRPSEPFFGFNVTSNEINGNLSNNSQESQNIDGEKTEESDTSVDSQDIESLYDTCNSDKYAEISNEVIEEPEIKESIVKVAKMDDAIFQQYYKKMPAYVSDLSGEEDMDEESENTSDNPEIDISNSEPSSSSDVNGDKKIEVGLDEYSNPDQDSIMDSDSSITESDDETYSPQASISESEGSVYEDFESNSDNDQNERCFVSTRQRVTIKHDSNKLSLDNSSSASSECDKTVLSNNKLTLNRSRLNEISQNDVKDSDEEENSKEKRVENDLNLNLIVDSINLDSDETEKPTIDARISFVTTRKSSKKLSTLPKSPEINADFKPTIVLQPGKKWERSLSIYRRMTMMNDNFERSILEDEPLSRKGRKYRQSVISTMEMQEGSLHNETISSRRSTLVVKPCRSTIKILKEANSSRISLCNTTIYDDLKGFLSDDCDDTIVELSKLSIADSDHDITVVDKFHEDRLTTARDYVLRRCNQTEPILFDECYPDTALKNCHKIGEGVYGEVFLWRARDGRARVMKIVPIAGTTKVNGENQKDFQEIISEIVIAMELSALRTPIADLERQFDEGKEADAIQLQTIQNATDVFNEVLAVRCVYGSYTSRLLDLWELYDECKGSENDNPAILPRDQQYIVLELANAGQDLESYQFNNAEQAYALFLQVAFGLAVGEEAFQFEHRDLHWGNVLIAPTEQKYATFVLRGRSHRVPRRGVAATIIDYSLSRLSLPLSPAGDAAALYNDLATDDGLFDAFGDYQFDCYRLMRDKLGNDWKNFEPYTNIIWLHYTADKMITALRYKRTNTKIHKHYISKLKALKDRILSYGSAVQFVLTDIEY